MLRRTVRVRTGYSNKSGTKRHKCETLWTTFPKTGKDRQRHMSKSLHKPFRTTVFGRTLDKRDCRGLFALFGFTWSYYYYCTDTKFSLFVSIGNKSRIWILSMCWVKRVHPVREMSFYRNALKVDCECKKKTQKKTWPLSSSAIFRPSRVQSGL